MANLGFFRATLLCSITRMTKNMAGSHHWSVRKTKHMTMPRMLSKFLGFCSLIRARRDLVDAIRAWQIAQPAGMTCTNMASCAPLSPLTLYPAHRSTPGRNVFLSGPEASGGCPPNPFSHLTGARTNTRRAFCKGEPRWPRGQSQHPGKGAARYVERSLRLRSPERPKGCGFGTTSLKAA